jgi:hypothetical protein
MSESDLREAKGANQAQMSKSDLREARGANPVKEFSIRIDLFMLIGRHLKSVQWEREYKHVNIDYMCM